MSKQKYFYDVLDKEDIAALNWQPSEEGNLYITETAGFIPLEVKMKQFEQNGIIAQFQVSDFTSNDYREIYLNPDFEITPEDELEDIQDKLNARNEYIQQIKKSKSNGNNDKAGTVEPEKQPEQKPAEPVKDE